MCKNYTIITLLIICFAFQSYAQLKVGDPGVSFDQSKFDSNWPQMQRWSEAGVRGGIPFITDLVIKKTLDSTNSAGLNKAIKEVADSGGGTILLKNGNYDINAKVGMQSKVNLIGESRYGVKCIIDMNNYNAFRFENVNHCGIYRLTIQGSWGKPKYDWNLGIEENHELTDNTNISVKLMNSVDCWLDAVDIINSAHHPLVCASKHVTIRNCKVDGCHNKAQGAQGYFFIADSDNLITNNKITHIRHITMQNVTSEYNVFYKNDFHQEISFHSNDNGNNLIEQNKVTLPSDMNTGYYAIMGPWSIKHKVSRHPNFIYKNTCLESNHGDTTPWSNSNVIYNGPYEVKPSNPLTNFRAMNSSKLPKGRTLYPVVLSSSSKAPINQTIYLKASNGKYVKIDPNNTNFPLLATSEASNWASTKFQVIDAGNGKIALKSVSNGKYVSARTSVTNAPLQANRTAIGSWEKFTWENQANDVFALKASANGLYIKYDPNETNYPVQATGTKVWSTAKFSWKSGLKSASIQTDTEKIEEQAINMEQDMSVEQEALIFPNPFSSEITVANHNKYKQLEIFNMMGKMVDSFPLPGNEEIRYAPSYSLVPSGVYVIKLIGDSETKAFKVIRK